MKFYALLCCGLTLQYAVGITWCIRTALDPVGEYRVTVARCIVWNMRLPSLRTQYLEQNDATDE